MKIHPSAALNEEAMQRVQKPLRCPGLLERKTYSLRALEELISLPTFFHFLFVSFLLIYRSSFHTKDSSCLAHMLQNFSVRLLFYNLMVSQIDRGFSDLYFYLLFFWVGALLNSLPWSKSTFSASPIQGQVIVILSCFAFIPLFSYCVFYKPNVCGNPALSQSINIFSLRVSVSYFGNSGNILTFFIIIMSLMMICDQ